MRRLIWFFLLTATVSALVLLVRGNHTTGPTAAPRAATRRCTALTRRGGRCTRRAEAGSDRCWQHG